MKLINLDRNSNISKANIDAIVSQINQPGDLDTNPVHDGSLSDGDDRSLAVSEPPMSEENAAFNDYARRPSVNVINVSESSDGVVEYIDTCSEREDNISDKQVMSKSIAQLTHDAEPMLDIKKSRSLDNVAKFGDDFKDFEDHILEYDIETISLDNTATSVATECNTTVKQEDEIKDEASDVLPNEVVNMGTSIASCVSRGTYLRPTSAPVTRQLLHENGETVQLKCASYIALDSVP